MRINLITEMREVGDEIKGIMMSYVKSVEETLENQCLSYSKYST